MSVEIHSEDDSLRLEVPLKRLFGGYVASRSTQAHMFLSILAHPDSLLPSLESPSFWFVSSLVLLNGLPFWQVFGTGQPVQHLFVKRSSRTARRYTPD